MHQNLHASDFLDVTTIAAAVGVFKLFPPEALELSGLLFGALILIYLRRSVSWSDRIFYALSSVALGALVSHGLNEELTLRYAVGDHWYPLIGCLAVLPAFFIIELVRALARTISSRAPELGAALMDRFIAIIRTKGSGS